MPIPTRKLLHQALATVVTFAAITIPLPARTAEEIVAHYPPIRDITVSVRDLEDFARDGKIPANYADLAKQVSPAQLQQFRQALQQRFEASPVYVSQLTDAPLTRDLFDRIGELIQPDSRQNGFRSLRSALISAAKDRKDGLTILNFLRRFPGRQIHLDLAGAFAIYDNFTELFKRRDNMVVTLDRLATAEAETSKIDFSSQLDLRQAGTSRWQKRQFEWLDRRRSRMVPGDLYLPQKIPANPIPVIVISHGVGEDRTTYAYLAAHLASYGFGVAVVEHVGENADRLQKYFSGMAPAPPSTELLDRPRDVSFLLDELQRQGKSDPMLRQLDLRQVGLIGHSFGGYTVLALAGAEIDFDRVKRDCNPNRSLNLSVLLQCTAKDLKPQQYALKDPRIKAIFAISPLDSTIFGRRGMSQIRTPVLLMGGSDDIITPAVPEQIYPFTWLQTPDKYLAILEKGTHFSTQFISKSKSGFPVSDSIIGPAPEQAQTYAKVLGVAFFQTHLANRSEFQPYLNAAYPKSLEPTTDSAVASGGVSLRLNLVGASAADAIVEALEQDNTRAPKLTW